MLKVLLAGGSTGVATRLSTILKVRWHDLRLIHVTGPQHAPQKIVAEGPHLILLYPDGLVWDWFGLIGEVRSASQVPIVVVSDSTTTLERIQALEAGAEDWVAPSCDPMELLARLSVCLRRAGPSDGHRRLCGPLSLDLRSQQAEVNGRAVRLTPHEYRVLAHLVDREGTTVGHDELLLAAWGPGYEGDPDLVRKYVWRLRSKLEKDPAQPTLIVNRRGSGYALATSCNPD